MGKIPQQDGQEATCILGDATTDRNVFGNSTGIDRPFPVVAINPPW
jgi:hypothetical protein